MNELTIALVGNPNTGKSSLFNALAGLHQQVGNYPGVTVEKKVGQVQLEETSLTLIDVPGTYSLVANSPDEQVAVSVLLGSQPGTTRPDRILCVVDASNLARNLYLVTQVLEMGLPVIVALTMVDIAEQRGLEIDIAGLSEALGVPVVATQPNRKKGIAPLKEVLVAEQPAAVGVVAFPDLLEHQVEQLASGEKLPAPLQDPFLARRLLLDATGSIAEVAAVEMDEDARRAVEDARQRVKTENPVHGLEPVVRYGWIKQVVDRLVSRQEAVGETGQGRLDRLLTHRISGTLIFIVVMGLLFQAVFSWALPMMDVIDGSFAWLGSTVGNWIPPGALHSLVVDGVIAGVGSVVIFLPQIIILFFFIGWLEGCGYMARAAYLMDRLMAGVGLSGRSFIPLLSSFACAIPGIMAARVIKNPRDRLTTILVAPLMSCSARLPVYVLLTAACIPDQRVLGGWLGLQGLVLFSMYVLGVVVAIIVAFILKTTLLKGPTPPFIMELPGFKLPNLVVVSRRMLSQGWDFVRQAGTLIFAVTVLVWAAGYFPHDPEVESQLRESYQQRFDQLADEGERAELQAELDAAVSGEYLRNSVLGKMGQTIEPFVQPLGWDWKIGISVIASFPAREVVIGTMGVIYNLGGDTDEESATLRDHVRTAHWDGEPDRKVFTIPVALSMMVFFALCAQCASTLVVMKRETNSWRWPLFTFVYMTGIAYLAAMLIYQLASRF